MPKGHTASAGTIPSIWLLACIICSLIVRLVYRLLNWLTTIQKVVYLLLSLASN